MDCWHMHVFELSKDKKKEHNNPIFYFFITETQLISMYVSETAVVLHYFTSQCLSVLTKE
jgi:hypothetical protein